jgi:hypothetical protein
MTAPPARPRRRPIPRLRKTVLRLEPRYHDQLTEHAAAHRLDAETLATQIVRQWLITRSLAR